MTSDEFLIRHFTLVIRHFLALTLLVLFCLANHQNLAVTLDDTAVFAAWLN